MDVFSNTSAWLQHSPAQVARSSSQVVQGDLTDSQRPPSSADWKDPPPSASGSNGASTVSGNIDLHDFDLGDLSAPQTSSTSLTTPSPFFNYSNNFFIPSVPPPYNAMSYGTSSWSPQPGQVPLSTYSTLNGATSTSSPQSPPSHPSQANIDPALTTLSTSSPPLSYSPPANISQQQASQHHLPLHSHYPQLSSLSIAYTQASPSPLAPTHSQATQSQPQSHSQPQQPQPSQGTLSPFALHAPQHLSVIPPSSFYNAIPQSDSPAPPSQSRREAFLNAIKSSLQTKSFSGGARSVQQLVSRIIEYGILEVSAQTRLDILTKIRDNAGNNYFRAWLENVSAMDITREWLKTGATAGADNQVLETVMPLLHIADRLPFTGETLVSSKIGKIVRKLAKDAPIPAIKDMAANLERKWRSQFVFMQDQVMPADDDVQDAKQKKRKLPDAPSKPGPPAKKSAVSVASSSRPSVVVKKEGRPSTTTTVAAAAATMKESKSDSSFFSAPKQKPKLPSFKKAPAGATTSTTIKKESPANVAQPSSTDAFQEALKDMARARKPSPAAPSTSSSSNTEAVSSAASVGAKLLKKKKSVTWAPDGQLELVKLIERAVYDDDPIDGMPHALHNVRELERGEGAALHAHLFEEVLDWSEPQLIDIPEDIEARPRGEGSQERGAQEQRELTALGASYLAQPIPDSPADLPPGSVLSQEQVDENIVHMLAGAEIDALSWPPATATSPLAGASVAELVGQLAAESMGTNEGLPDAVPTPGFDPALLAQLASSIPQEQLQQLAQIFATQQQQPPQPQLQGDQQSWDTQAPAFPADAAGGAPRDRWPPTPEEPRWSGVSGRGRGRGRPLDGSRQFRSRIPCSFYAQGRQAHISHVHSLPECEMD
ncbi:hypothetical protein BJV78DRAFT_1153194 [Lactifluus subvellereus]|nr:hypothetical protein BJV78DRAFT_1153194 [Lactifluus subvellereus]